MRTNVSFATVPDGKGKTEPRPHASSKSALSDRFVEVGRVFVVIIAFVVASDD
jgi:hypothetical protein